MNPAFRFERFLYNMEGATKALTVATVAMRCDRNPDRNRANMATTIDSVMQAHPDVNLVIFGEMVLGHYDPGKDPLYHQAISEPIPGSTTQALAEKARQHKIHICFGVSEQDEETIHNSQVLLNPQGEIQTVHRKRNLKPGEIAADYQPGPRLVTATDIRGIKMGIVICSDTASPHTMWELVRGRYELIIHSLADDDQDDFVTLFQARLYDAWFVTANRFGEEVGQFWPGLITVTDPLGRIRGRSLGQEQVLVHELQFADRSSGLRRIVRGLWVKAPLILHVLRNLKQARTYL